MEEPTETKSEAKRFSVWAFIMWPTMLLVLYVLSIGPVALMDSKHMLSVKAEEFCETFYAPLFWVGNKTPLGKALDMYVGLWEHGSGIEYKGGALM